MNVDNDMWNAPDYGCGNKQFERYTEKDDIKNCMEKIFSDLGGIL